MNMSIEAQKQMKMRLAEVTEKLKQVNDFVDDIAGITDCMQHNLSQIVVRARLLRRMAPSSTEDLEMTAWNPTWKSWHTPIWFRKACRHWLSQNKLWIPYRDPIQLMLWTENIYKILFDHIGSIGEGAMRSVVLQPNGNYDATAKAFAEALRVRLEIIRPGVWHHDTTTYVLHYGVT